ncbi:MAG: hypothetical protein Q9172_003001 [Xanthocarpia lactea]
MTSTDHFEGGAEGTNLLSLPRELRDRIYEWVLHLDVPPPSSPDEDEQRRTVYKRLSHIRIPKQVPQTSSSSLLRCNRQISNELSQTIARCGITYALDIMLKDKGEDVFDAKVDFYPTWIKLPAPLRHLKYLDVNIRLRDFVVLYSHGFRRSWIYILGSVFLYTPIFPEPGSPYDSSAPYYIQELRLNVEENCPDKLPAWAPIHREEFLSKFPAYLRHPELRDTLPRRLGAISYYWHGKFKDRFVLPAGDLSPGTN